MQPRSLLPASGPLRLALLGTLLVAGAAAAAPAPSDPFHTAELLFPPEGWHNHGSCIVEAPGGDLLVCWFHGSGERTADDVKIEGAWLKRGTRQWSERITLADTPGYPDTNCAMFIDPRNRLWLLWPTILANRWESALMKYQIASDYRHPTAPRWEFQGVLHVTPGPEFETEVQRVLPAMATLVDQLPLSPQQRREADEFLAASRDHSTNTLYRRLGWMTRAHPFVLDAQRLIVPLYHDGFSFSLMAITDDWGATWHTSRPLIGAGNIQPSIAQRQDGSLYTVMRDNGPPPKRLLQAESRDRGETWSDVTDSPLPNPGSGSELLRLRNGHWVIVGNDTETGRHSLAVWLSEDEGRHWPWMRHLEFDPPGPEAGSYHYPSIIQAHDGTLHVSYSHFSGRADLPKDAQGRRAHKSIKHAHFNEAWIKAGSAAPEG